MNQYRRISLYFAAHPDDWQLFMSPDINRDINDKNCKVIIIHITAGDAGNKEDYWEAREEASNESLLFSISSGQRFHSVSDILWLGNKKLRLVTISNSRSYFLRIPDGGSDGTGFPLYENQSLEKFYTEVSPNLTTVDKGNEYRHWHDLVETIDEIITREATFPSGQVMNDVCLNFPEYDKILNPNDHSDHYMTSQLVQSTSAYKKHKKRAFAGYSILYTSHFLTGEELFWKVGTFSSYHFSLFKRYGHSTISEDTSYISWCLRQSSCRDV